MLVPNADKRPKILHLGKFYPPHKGGMETHLEQLCSSLQTHFNVTIIAANDSKLRTIDQAQYLTVIRLGTLRTVASSPICPGLVRELRNTPADIIHIHHPNPLAFWAYILSSHPAKLVVTYHSDIVRQKWLRLGVNPLVRHVLNKSSAIIVTSPSLINCSAVLPKFQERCRVIPLGVDAKKFESVDMRKVCELRVRYGSRIILSVGRLVYYKGFEYLIRAMRDVQATLLLVGTGPLEDQLRREIQRLSLWGSVHFLGEIQDIVPYFHAADIFVLPSIHQSEAFGFVQLEAMVCGRPVINTSLASGVPFVSTHGLTGLTVPPANASALAGAINQLLDDAQLRAKYGANARIRASCEFSLSLMVERTMDLYEEVLRSPYRAEIPAFPLQEDAQSAADA